ncbi:MAG TPA: YceI family protein [Acidimicrobiales bacterium]|nr:YceI family protein [Acidimicrobiales bacterium]
MKKWLLGGIAAALLVFVGGPFLYIHVFSKKAPPKLSLSTTATTAGASSDDPAISTNDASVPLDGTWKVSSGSTVGYRVKEVLFGQSNTAVGRTSSVTGQFAATGTSINSGSFTVDMTTVTSDKSMRDHQFHGRIMETSTFPTATFELTKPIDLGSVPADGVTKSVPATGKLTLHGVTKTVTIPLTAKRTSNSIEVSGSLPITFADWNISNPSFGGTVTTEDHGLLELLLKFSPA